MDRNTEFRGGGRLPFRGDFFSKIRTPVWHHSFPRGQEVRSRNVIPDQNWKNPKFYGLLLWLHFVKKFCVEIFTQIGVLSVLPLDNVSPLHWNCFFGHKCFLVNRGRSTTWSSPGKAIILCRFLLFWLVLFVPPDVRSFNISTVFVLYMVDVTGGHALCGILNH